MAAGRHGQLGVEPGRSRARSSRRSTLISWPSPHKAPRGAKRRMHVMDTGGALACRSMLTQRTSPIAKILGMLVSNSWAGRVRDDCGITQL